MEAFADSANPFSRNRPLDRAIRASPSNIKLVKVSNPVLMAKGEQRRREEAVQAAEVHLREAGHAFLIANHRGMRGDSQSRNPT